MTNLGRALAAYQQKHDVENKDMAEAIGISASTLSRIKNGSMPDADVFSKVMIWLLAPTSAGSTGGANGPFA